MTAKSKKIVIENGDYAIEREEYWGFRCQATSVSWNVLKGGHQVTTCRRLKDAKREVIHRVALDSEVDSIHKYLLAVPTQA